MEEKTSDQVVTDAAEELALFWTNLSKFKPKLTKITHAAFAEYFGVGSRKSVIVRLLGVIAKRLMEFDEFVSSTDHPLATMQIKESVREAVAKMGEVISLPTQSQSWAESINKLHPAEIAVVGSFSHIARASQPLRLVAEAERLELGAQIDAVINDLKSDSDMAPWAREALIASLTETRFTVRYLPTFGHAALADQLVAVRERFDFVLGEIEKGSDVVTDKGKHTLAKLANVLMFAFNLIAVPPQAAEYMGWYATTGAAIYQNFQSAPEKQPYKPTPILLEAPGAKRDEELDGDQD